MRLVGDNVEQGVYPIDQARKMAQEQNLDLVEISPTATPPVCRVIDYSKFKYEQKKKTRELKAKQTKVVLKEIRFGPNTDEHDFDFKVKHAQEFLREGAKIKSYVHFVGRSIVFKERGEILLLKFAQALEDLAKVEQLPKLEGKRMFLYLAPKAAAVAKAAAKPAAAGRCQGQEGRQARRAQSRSTDSPPKQLRHPRRRRRIAFTRLKMASRPLVSQQSTINNQPSNNHYNAESKDEIRCQEALCAHRNGQSEAEARLQIAHSDQEDHQAEARPDPHRSREQRRHEPRASDAQYLISN